MNRHPLRRWLADSAFVITGLSMVLYLWGAAHISFLRSSQDVPTWVGSEASFQQIVLMGGIVTLFYLGPIGAVVWLIWTAQRKTQGRPKPSWREIPANKWPAVVGIGLFASVAIVAATAWLTTRLVPKDRIDRITLKRESTVTSSLAGQFLISADDRVFVIADRPTERDARITVISRDEVAEIQLARDND